MTDLSLTLLLAAVGIGVTHTLLGPDHYLPFVMLAKARSWSKARTLTIAALCGLGHVIGSILLGVIGLLVGMAVGEVEAIEGMRGDWAAWLLLAFGVAYGAWGVRRAVRKKRDIEPHEHDGHVHVHAHGSAAHSHKAFGSSATFWALLVAFILGPCEPLIPLFLVPASRGRWDVAIATAVVFGVATILTMLLATFLGLVGMDRLSLGPVERWAHAFAGGVIALSGLAIITLGL